jgi:hypothetical protein
MLQYVGCRQDMWHFTTASVSELYVLHLVDVHRSLAVLRVGYAFGDVSARVALFKRNWDPPPCSVVAATAWL